MVASEDEVDNPIPHRYDLLIIMDLPAVNRIGSVQGGTVIVNSSLVGGSIERTDINRLSIAATEIAEDALPVGFREARLFTDAAIFGALVRLYQGTEIELESVLSIFSREKERGLLKYNLDVARKAFRPQ